MTREEAIEIMKNPVDHMDENKHGFEPKQEFTMGGIAWTVIQTGTDWVKCITSECVEKGAFDTGNKNNFFASSLRYYLNGEFLNRLIQAGVPEEMFEDFVIDLTADDGLKDYGGDRVRIGLITCEEYRLLRGNIPALPGHLWWTVTADSPVNFLVRYVYLDGSLGGCQACDVGEGIRPICVLKSELLASYLGNKNCRRKTRLQDFLEKYPDAPMGEDRLPFLAPRSLGYCEGTLCFDCKKAQGKSWAWCWEQEVEDDETD